MWIRSRSGQLLIKITNAYVKNKGVYTDDGNKKTYLLGFYEDDKTANKVLDKIEIDLTNGCTDVLDLSFFY